MAKQKTKKSNRKIKESTVYVDGMHCASCELIIEKKLLNKQQVEAVDASTKDGRVVIYYKDESPSIDELNKEFEQLDYKFQTEPVEQATSSLVSFRNGELELHLPSAKKTAKRALIIIAFIVIFIWFAGTDIAANVAPTSGELNPLAFFIFGLGAGASTCAALVGGLLLSFSKNWNEQRIDSASKLEKLVPHGLFHIGRLVSFTLIGAVVALFGATFKSFVQDSAIFISIIVSLIMFVMAGQMLEWNWARKFQLSLPKSWSRFAANQDSDKGGIAPFLTGFLSFLIPCGLTITAFTLAIQAADPLTGAVNMLSFALGTLVFLGAISLAAVGFNSKPAQIASFNKIAGVLILFFALYTLNAQVIAMNAKYGIQLPSTQTVASIFSPTEAKVADSNTQGVQQIEMTVQGFAFEPAVFQVEAGTPVEFTIDGRNSSGCTGRLIGRGIFDGEVSVMGQVQTFTFTPTQKGVMPFSCWMGMVSGQIEVI